MAQEIKGIDPQVVELVVKAIKTNKGKATLKDITNTTKLPYRVVHNVTWRMEGSPKGGTLTKREEAMIKRVNTSRKVEYALITKGESTKFTPTMRGKYATRGSVEA